jgi:hypothetical protein
LVPTHRKQRNHPSLTPASLPLLFLTKLQSLFAIVGNMQCAAKANRFRSFSTTAKTSHSRSYRVRQLVLYPLLGIWDKEFHEMAKYKPTLTCSCSAMNRHLAYAQWVESLCEAERCRILIRAALKG